MKFKIDPAFIQWPFIEKLANNDLSRIVGIIPLVGYIILFNDEISGLISFDTIAGVENGTSSAFFVSGLTKMRLVFFGSLSLFLANAVFRIFRPKVLETSKGDIEFASEVFNTYYVADLTKMENAVHSERWQERLKIFWIIPSKTDTEEEEERSKETKLSQNRANIRANNLSLHKDYIPLLAREWWVGEMHTYKTARIATLILAILGYLMLAVPTLDIAQAVLRDIIASL